MFFSSWRHCTTNYLEALFQKIAAGVDKYMKRPERSMVDLGILMAEESAKWTGYPVSKLHEIDVEIEKLRVELQGTAISEEVTLSYPIN